MSLPHGRWQIGHPATTESIGHCLDFGLVAAYLHADLSEAQRSEAVRLVSEKLLASTWMRAGTGRPGGPVLEPARPWRRGGILRMAGCHRARPRQTRPERPRRDLAQRRAQLRVRRTLGPGNGNSDRQPRPVATSSRGRGVEPGLYRRSAIAEAVVSGPFGFEPTFCELADAPRPDSIDVPGIGSLLTKHRATEPGQVTGHSSGRSIDLTLSTVRGSASDAGSARTRRDHSGATRRRRPVRLSMTMRKLGR
jgi:hypothetical protein